MVKNNFDMSKISIITVSRKKNFYEKFLRDEKKTS